MKELEYIHTSKVKPCTPLRAIRMNCLECEGGPKGVRECIITGCPLHEFRLGHRPKRTTTGDLSLAVRRREFATAARAALKVKRKTEIRQEHAEEGSLF
ncbi:MAG TPA: hypothetical protein DET40_04640 [Lentisphaeria bacterium]|nr:MAG: hypothetical protein A2X45_21480 [Lentisphaerae bacterium GWF2_50_93]HCE42812.1 hypothetical protein [Lentisphaeria bacterium]